MNIEEQLSSVLNDPEAMSKISSIISSLGGGASPQNEGGESLEKEREQTGENEGGQGLAGLNIPAMGSDNRTRLLMSLKPFLSEKRAPYVDSAVAILRMMQLGKLSGSLEPIMSALGANKKS